jgi:hypothetical protein
VTQTKWVSQGCGLSPHFFNIFIHDIEYLDTEGTYSLVINGLRLPGLLLVYGIVHNLWVKKENLTS